MNSPEQAPRTAERGIESAGDAARERQAELLNTPEIDPESPERTAEKIESRTIEAKETAISHEGASSERDHAPADSAPVNRVANSRATRKKAYDDIMKHTRHELPLASRAFSKVIHAPVIETTSAVVGSTVARPNAILFGALFAIIISGGIYAIAKYYDYTLSGFEAIGAFIVGWVFGIIVDVLRLAFRRR